MDRDTYRKLVEVLNTVFGDVAQRRPVVQRAFHGNQVVEAYEASGQ